MNKIILMGRLTRDPEIRYSQGDNSTAIARFSLAVDRKFKRDGEPSADFFNCTAFGKQGEFVEKYLKQGTKVVITGRVQNDNYTNGHGEKVYSVQIMVEEMEFAESKNNSNNSNNGNNSTHGSTNNSNNQAAVNPDGFMNIPEGFEELPFN